MENYLPKTIFICPDAPEKCSISPSGFQWFELGEYSEDQILAKSLVSEAKLNKLIDEVKEKNNISADKIPLGNSLRYFGQPNEIDLRNAHFILNCPDDTSAPQFMNIEEGICCITLNLLKQ